MFIVGIKVGIMNNSKKSQYSPRKLQKCLEDVKNKVFSISNAAKLYNIPRSTISCKIHQHRPERKGRNGPESVLGADMEKKIVDWLLNQAKRGFPLSKNSLLFSVTKLISSCFDSETIKNLPFRDGRPGEKWYQSFMKRHPIIVKKRSEYLSLARASNTEVRIRQWYQDVLDLLGNDADILQHPKRLYNVDESAFFLNNNGKVVLAERGKSVYDISTNSEKDNVTVSICVNAIGEMAPPLVVYKYIRLPAVYGSSLPPNWSIGTSETGWMNSETFFEYFANVFIPFVKKKHPDESIIVFFDGHKSHLSIQVSNLAEENRIQLICLPASTTHFMQPLDVSYFKPLKSYWKKERDFFEFENKRSMFKYEVPKILQVVFDKYNLNNAMVNGFRKCGLFPFDPNNVDYSKCMGQKPPVENESPSAKKSSTQSILEFFESKIDSFTLQNFRASQGHFHWDGDEKFTALYDLWRKLVADNTSYAPVDADSILLDVPESYEPAGGIFCSISDVKSISDLPGPSNVHNVSGIEFLCQENEIKNIEVLNLDEEITNGVTKMEWVPDYSDPVLLMSLMSELEPVATSTPEKTADEQIPTTVPKEDCIYTNENALNTKKTDSLVPNTMKETVKESIRNSEEEEIITAKAPDLSNSSVPEKLPDESIQNVAPKEANSSVSLKSVDDALLELTRADFTKKRGKMKASSSKTYPVITSVQWRELEMLKQKDKEEAEKHKETNRLKRLEKKNANQLKRKKPMNFESEEMVDDPEPLPDEAITKRRQKKRRTDVAVQPLGQIGNIVQDKSKTTKPVGRPRKQNAELVAGLDLNIGSWVLVLYDNEKYPGIITKYDEAEDEFEVRTLQKIQYHGALLWKWPEREDRAYYERRNILKILPSPEVESGKKRGAGLFHFSF